MLRTDKTGKSGWRCNRNRIINTPVFHYGSCSGTEEATYRFVSMPTVKISQMQPQIWTNGLRYMQLLKHMLLILRKCLLTLRLLSSDLAGIKTISIPERQVGSSIMPGKINPVIPEFVISAAHKIYSNDVLISSLSGQGVS